MSQSGAPRRRHIQSPATPAVPPRTDAAPPSIDFVKDPKPQSDVPGWLIVVLGLVIVVNAGQGFFDLLFNAGDAVDVLQRWVEQRYVLHGQNPFDVLQGSNYFPGYGSPLWTARNIRVDPSLSVPIGASYPPWSYLLGNVLYWPPQAWMRGYFAVVETLALVYLFSYGYSVARRNGSRAAAIIVGMSAISVSSIAATVSLGQFGLIDIAALAATEQFTFKRRPVSAGITLAVALCKPNIAALFVLPFLFRLFLPAHRRRAAITLLTTGAALGVGSLTTWWQTHTNPIEMTMQWLRIARFLPIEPFGFMESLIRLGCSAVTANRIAFYLWSSAAVVLIYLWRRSRLLVQFAIACVAGRLWTYHRMYDNVMFSLLLLNLALVAMVDRKRWAMPVYLLVGVSLWLPVHFVGMTIANVQRLIWLVGLGTLLWSSGPDVADSNSFVTDLSQ